MESFFEENIIPESLNLELPLSLIETQFFYFEAELDCQIEAFLTQTLEKTEETEDIPKKRGRKKIRPSNPTKTEIMDKFWLRGFREFMKMNYSDLKNHLSDSGFWVFFLGKSGNPGKKRKYLSFSKNYKNFLASNKAFCELFIAWIILYGSIKVPRKNFKGNWELYFNYLCTDLVQPCKKLVTVGDIKNSLRILSSVFNRYLLYNQRLQEFATSE